QRKAPLETLFHGERLFLSQPVEEKIDRMAFHIGALELTNTAFSIGDVMRRLRLPDAVRVTAKRKPGHVIETIRTREGAVEADYTMSPSGRIQSVIYKLNPAPEILAYVFMAWTGIGAVGPPANFVLTWLALSVVLRAACFSALFTHGFGHVFVKFLVDKG